MPAMDRSVAREYTIRGKKKQRTRYERGQTAPETALPEPSGAPGAPRSGRRSRSPGTTDAPAEGEAGGGTSHDDGLVLFMRPEDQFPGS